MVGNRIPKRCENKMNYETLKHIYREVLLNKNKIQYNGDDKYTITAYHSNGNKYWEQEYQNGQLHGKSFGWWENGNKHWEKKYQNNQLHGKYIVWDENGNKHWKTEYQNDQRHGKHIVWWENGNKYWEAEYRNGVRIK